MLRRTLSVVILAASILAFGVRTFAQQQPATGNPANAAQVQQLQEQLAKMQTEMDAMQKSMQTANLPPEQLQTMRQHMATMQTYWQKMHAQCCGMNPSGHGCGGMMGGGMMGHP